MSGADEAEHALVQSQLRERPVAKPRSPPVSSTSVRSIWAYVWGRSSSLRRALR